MPQPVICQHCDSAIPAENFNNLYKLAICPNCDTIQNLGGTIRREEAIYRHMYTPKRFHITDTPDGLEIKYEWYNESVYTAAMTAIIWNAMLIFFLLVIIPQPQLGPKLFMIPFVLMGLYLLQQAVTQWVNITRIRLTNRTVGIWHGPIPTGGNKLLDRRAIEQVYVKANINRPNRSSTGQAYDVFAVIKGGEDYCLIRRLDYPKQALFIEQEIENYLDIKNKPLPGEYEK